MSKAAAAPAQSAAPAAPAPAPQTSAPATAPATPAVRVVVADPVPAPLQPVATNEESLSSRWERIKSGGVPPEQAAATEQAADPENWYKPEKPPEEAKPIQSVHDRIRERDKRRAEAQSQQALQAQLQQLQEQNQQLTQRQAQAHQQFQQLVNEGRVDEAYKVVGLNMSHEEITRRSLIARGALPEPNSDPRVDQLLQERDQMRQQWEQQQEQLRQQQQRQAQEEMWRQDEAAVQQEVATIKALPQAEGFAQLPGVSRSVLLRVHREPDKPFEEHAAAVDADYAALFKQLLPVYGPRYGLPGLPDAQAQQAAPVVAEQSAPARRAAPVARPAPATAIAWDDPDRYQKLKRKHGII